MKRPRMITAILAILSAAAIWAPAAQGSYGFSSTDVTFTNEDGSELTQAGAHPFAMTTKLHFNTREDSALGYEVPDGDTRNLIVAQMPGLIGDPTATPRCEDATFTSPGGQCPVSTVIGYNDLDLITPSEPPERVEVYNLAPPAGVAMRIGFKAAGIVPVTVNLTLSDLPPYNVIATVTGVPQVVTFYSSELTLWGNPADKAHDGERGGRADIAEVPFLSVPRTCAGPQLTSFESDSWQLPGVFAHSTATTHDDATPPSPQGFTGCGRLGFNPSITAAPTTKAAESPTGLDFSLDVNDEGLTNPTGLTSSDIEKAVVTLPKGFTVNPSIAEGLAVCTEGQLAAEAVRRVAGQGCPDASKIGTVEVQSPLIEETVDGTLYQAAPYENPFHSLIALYIVIRNEKLGILVKQPIRVEPDPVSGQLHTIAEDLPQLPYSHFKLHFREGTRSPLASPPACGTYDAEATLYPYSGTAAITTTSAFQIITGPESKPCPSGGLPPFKPSLTAGTLNNAAGRFSPFNVRLSRTDSEQEITHFSIKLPPGVTGKLAGIPFCSDAQIAAAKARERQPHGGQEELGSPSCPQASEIGRTLVGAGVGPSLTYVPGKVYLAGPYKGSNLSIVAITVAKAGPFDLGTVVIREALKVDPVTAEVSVDGGTSDPIPHIIDGIPVHLRDIRVYVDRPEFVKNPTSCEPTSTASTVLGSGTDFASEADDRPITVTSRFQAADCASLGFKPKLKISLKGPTRRAGLPALTAVVTPRAGDANIGRAVVTLPKSEFLEQGHIGNSCTRVQFNAGGGNGEQCPADSVLGHAVAVTPLLSEPLEGPVFLRSNGGERKLPDLVAALHSTDINIDLVGFISSLHKKGSDVSQIRSTFAAVPDQPVTSFTLQMFGGKKGLLVNSTNLCKGTHKAISELGGQNGKRYDTERAVKVKCPKKHKKKSKGHRKAKGGATRGGGAARLALARFAW